MALGKRFEVLEPPVTKDEYSSFHRAYDYDQDRNVLLRVFTKSFLTRPELRAKAQEEYRLLGQCNDDNLARVLEAGWSDDPPWVALEEAGHCVGELVAKAPLSPDKVRSVLRQVLDALHYMHATRKRAHGNITPHSLFVAPDLAGVKLVEPRVIDLDRAVPPPAPNQRYVAPELIEPSFGRVTIAGIDLYLAGYCALEMLLGGRFDGLFRNLAAADGGGEHPYLRWHSSSEPPPTVADLFQNIPGDLARVIEGLIHKQVHVRYASAEKALEDLEPGDRVPLISEDVAHRGGPGEVKQSERKYPVLEIRDDAGDGEQRVFLHTRDVLIGARPNLDIPVADESVSQLHAIIVCELDRRWVVHDLKSRTGVKVNDQPTRRQRLEDGDRLTIGPKDFSVRISYRHIAVGQMSELGGFRLLVEVRPTGRMGPLYRAEWKEFDGRQVAVKIFDPVFVMNVNLLKRFERDLAKSASLKHPHLVRHFKAGTARDKKQAEFRIYLAMEWMPGRSLRDRLRGGRKLPLKEVSAMAIGIAEAIGFIADEGQVHRAICPSAILFAADGTPKLGNIVLTRCRENATTTFETADAKELPLDMPYMPVEQFRRDQTIDLRTDLYALAVCLFEALAGRPPFVGDAADPARIIYEVTSAKLPDVTRFAPELPGAFDDFFRRALSREASGRFSTAAEFISGWRSAEAVAASAAGPGSESTS
jgi:serine/threonine protein kinase